MKELELYQIACDNIARKFCEKQGFDFENCCWADDIRDILVINNEYSFKVPDMELDLKKEAPKGLILEWQNSQSEYSYSVYLHDYLSPTIEQLYEKWKGTTVKDGCSIGVVCGYSTTSIIIALTVDYIYKWFKISDKDHIITHQNNKLGYYYVSPKILENND